MVHCNTISLLHDLISTPISDRFYILWRPFPTSMYTAKTVNSVSSRAFKQSSTRGENKRSIYTCKIFLFICLSDLVPLEHPFCFTVFAGINLNFIHIAILRSGSFPHVNSKFCRLCRKYYFNVSLPFNAIVLS